MMRLHAATRSFALVYVAMFVAAMVALGGCASTSPPVPTEPGVQAEPWQLRAAARCGLTAMEESGIDLHTSGALHGDDWRNYVDACKTARGLLYQTGLAGLDPADILKAIAIAKAAVKAGQAAWVMANAAAIGEETAAEYEQAGAAADKAFDSYAALHPV